MTKSEQPPVKVFQAWACTCASICIARVGGNKIIDAAWPWSPLVGVAEHASALLQLLQSLTTYSACRSQECHSYLDTSVCSGYA